MSAGDTITVTRVERTRTRTGGSTGARPQRAVSPASVRGGQTRLARPRVYPGDKRFTSYTDRGPLAATPANLAMLLRDYHDPAPATPRPRRTAPARQSVQPELIETVRTYMATHRIDPAGLVMQPPQNDVLINEPVIVYTTRRHQDFVLTLGETTVPIHAQAVLYRYAWGDGETTTTTRQGAPYPKPTITHTYRRGEPTRITLTTTWKITAKDPVTGAWIELETPLTTTETSRTFALVSATTYLTNPTYAPPAS
ncbi:hypothetical protein H8R18_07825 [Nanchangia anserum]|uniref:hypothetical protein n=1 Tax=Nanchangia anserum TaxID=2692125 RepID=UPI0018837149|nr:hypothetical protein [Nanchangia anserum]QOX81633.1 hypothetical protein H8R18_07825 [Nanchangia anserum]